MMPSALPARSGLGPSKATNVGSFGPAPPLADGVAVFGDAGLGRAGAHASSNTSAAVLVAVTRRKLQRLTRRRPSSVIRKDYGTFRPLAWWLPLTAIGRAATSTHVADGRARASLRAWPDWTR